MLFVGLLFAVFVSSCRSSGPGGSAAVVANAQLSLGASVSGATLSGALSGKQIYLLGGSANRSKCWQDSEYWDGTTLWYAVTNTSWTQLAAASTFSADPGCTLSSDQTGVLFNVYGATPNGIGDWTFIHPSFNSAAANIAAPKLSGQTMAAVVYEKTNSYGNIYLVKRNANNSWGVPVAFNQNPTSCNDDNPMIYANGSKIIFESSRSAAAVGSSCLAHQKLWSSSPVSGTWETPVALTGGPTLGAAATQPWLDETTGKL